MKAEKLAQEQDGAILLAIHDEWVLDLSDRIIYMEDGCLADHPVAANVH